MFAAALCVTAIIYLYAVPTIRKCCRSGRPIPTSIIDEYKDL